MPPAHNPLSEHFESLLALPPGARTATAEHASTLAAWPAKRREVQALLDRLAPRR
jgi:hypothetical protein